MAVFVGRKIRTFGISRPAPSKNPRPRPPPPPTAAQCYRAEAAAGQEQRRRIGWATKLSAGKLRRAGGGCYPFRPQRRLEHPGERRFAILDLLAPLLEAVAIPEGHGAVLERLAIHRDADRHPDLVDPSIAATDCVLLAV